jgi:hypothetical protein
VYEALNYSILFIPVTVVLLLISLTIPWVIINLRGQWSYTPIEIVGGIADGNAENESNFRDKPNFLRFTAVSQEITFDIVLSIITYLVSVGAMIVALVSLWKKNWSKIMLLAGILAIIASIAWIDAIQSFRTEATESGVNENLINAIVVLGFGPYPVAIAGVIASFGYFMEKIHRKQEQQKDAAGTSSS